MTKARVCTSAHEVVVTINDVPHLILRRASILAIQTWKMSVGVAEAYFVIEIVVGDNEVTCEYDNQALWEEIATGLLAARIFDSRLGETKS